MNSQNKQTDEITSKSVEEFLIQCGLSEQTAQIAIAEVTRLERGRAARIVKNWPITTHYIVGRIKRERLQKDMSDAILNDNQPELLNV